MTESKLVKLARQRNSNAIGELYEKHVDSIYRFALYKIENKEIAEDIVSEAFTKAFEKIDKFKEGSSFKTWLYAIARNLINDYLRHKSKHTVLAFEPVSVEEQPVDPKSEKLLHVILKKVKPERYKQILELKFLMNYTHQDIALELGITRNNSKVILNRALAKAKAITEKHNYEV